MPRIHLPAAMLVTLSALAPLGGTPALADVGPESERLTTTTETGRYPARGQRMTDVDLRFGVPRAKLPPVGDPPISRWVYEGFTVYFEREYVIHTVIDH